MMQGKGHSNQVQDMAVADDQLLTCGVDDVVISSSTHTNQYGSVHCQTQNYWLPKNLAILPYASKTLTF